MARGHTGLPRPEALVLFKTAILQSLRDLDADRDAVQRVLAMENDFRKRITSHVESLPLEDALFARFNTNPFVLLFHTLKKSYQHVGQIENDILPAKIFSSMETSAGRMVEAVVLPIYGWQCVASEMHSSESVIDGRKVDSKSLQLATLKSDPRCLNDEMSENIADAILANVVDWAKAARVKKVDFTYGVLYGTKKQSNKKDWHILRKIAEKLPQHELKIHPNNRWSCAFEKSDVAVDVTVRVGMELWNHFSDRDTAFLEMSCALIRACVIPTEATASPTKYTIADLGEILSLKSVPDDFNVSILQHSQWEWLFFFARHFCDQLMDQ